MLLGSLCCLLMPPGKIMYHIKRPDSCRHVAVAGGITTILLGVDASRCAACSAASMPLSAPTCHTISTCHSIQSVLDGGFSEIGAMGVDVVRAIDALCMLCRQPGALSACGRSSRWGSSMDGRCWWWPSSTAALSGECTSGGDEMIGLYDHDDVSVASR
jgi:hypothetical protein